MDGTMIFMRRAGRVAVLALLAIPITAVTATESLELRQYKTAWTNLRLPAYNVITAIQRDRLISARFLRSGADKTAMAAQQSVRALGRHGRQCSFISRGHGCCRHRGHDFWRSRR